MKNRQKHWFLTFSGIGFSALYLSRPHHIVLRKPHIFDNMITMMEKYTNNLEVLVDERTNLLIVEKKKTGEVGGLALVNSVRIALFDQRCFIRGV